MYVVTYKDITDILQEELEIIFDGITIDELSNYEKRSIIFNYLTRKLKYDYPMLSKIKKAQETNEPIRRDGQDELFDVIYNKCGICNGIAQYYKLLLEQVGIKSYCVVCDDGTSVNHQLNLVYSEDDDAYSFDDVTSVIVKRGSVDEFFNYDLEDAKEHNQGNREVMNNKEWFVLSEDIISYYVDRKDSPCESLDELPEDIYRISDPKQMRIHA